MRHVAGPAPEQPEQPDGPPRQPGQDALRPYCAYLRVYEPLAAFDAEERAAWSRYAGTASPRAEQLSAEHRTALAGVLAVPPRPVPTDEPREAFVLEAAGTVHVCPVQTRLRSWHALGQFRDGLPDTVVHAFLPPLALEQAEAAHATWAGTATGVPIRILTATWSVPVHWFVALAPGDREVRLDPPEVVLRTRMSAARRRVGRALRTLRRAATDSSYATSYAEDLEDVGRWLEDFHPRSWLELDYGGLARLLGAEAVSDDRSVEDVAAALEALSDGDLDRAGQAYRAVIEHWSQVQALEHAN